MGDLVNIKLMKEMIGDQDKFDFYLDILRSFFTFKILYKRMTFEVESLLTPEEIKLHNDLICTIMKKTYTGPYSVSRSLEVGPNPSHEDSKQRQTSKRRRAAYKQIQAKSAAMVACVPRVTPELADTFSICAPLGAFPDARYMYGTILVHAFSNDLEVVPEICGIYVAVAVKLLLKNVIRNILDTRHTTSRLRQYIPRTVAARQTNSEFEMRNLTSSSTCIIKKVVSKPGKLVPEVELVSKPGKLVPEVELMSKPGKLVPEVELMSKPGKLVPEVELVSKPGKRVSEVELVSKPGKPAPKVESTVHLCETEATEKYCTHNRSLAFVPISVCELYDSLMTKSEAIPNGSIRLRALEYCIVKIEKNNVRKKL